MSGRVAVCGLVGDGVALFGGGGVLGGGGLGGWGWVAVGWVVGTVDRVAGGRVAVGGGWRAVGGVVGGPGWGGGGPGGRGRGGGWRVVGWVAASTSALRARKVIYFKMAASVCSLPQRPFVRGVFFFFSLFYKA